MHKSKILNNIIILYSFKYTSMRTSKYTVVGYATTGTVEVQ